MALGSPKRGKKDEDAGDAKPADSADGKAESEQPEEPPRRFNKLVVGGIVGLAVAVAVAIYGAQSFVAEELKRETQAWQVRLGIVAGLCAPQLGDLRDAELLRPHFLFGHGRMYPLYALGFF